MARPIKVGLDYFPLDVTLEDKIELLEAECGLVGFAVLIKLWQKIYSNGYYIEWNEETSLLFCKRINADLTEVNSVINSCFKRSLFNKELFDAYKVLTSKGVQERYFKVCFDSKRKGVAAIREYMLVNPELIAVNVELTSIKSEFSTQRKGEESKEEESSKELKKSELINEAVAFHNSLDNLPRYRKLTESRKSSVHARIIDYGMEEVKSALIKANNSDFLNKKEKWYDFDWIYNPNNFAKIIEGKFDNKQTSKKEIYDDNPFAFRGAR